MKDECCNINQIINEFYNQLIGYLIKNLKNRDLAEDIVQEVMLKVVTAHQKNLQVKNLKAWLFQIARNTLIDHCRNQIKTDRESKEQINDLLYHIQDEPFSPADYLVPMINLLPEKYSIPLMLSDIDNVPQAEIAKRLELSISATKMRIQRARRMLYNLYIECCDIEYAKDGSFLYCTIKESCAPLKNLSK